MSDHSKRNSWVCLSEKKLHDSPFMELVQKECKSSEDERTHKFYVFKSRDWCNIIPITEDGKVVMVRQFRIGIAEHTLEIPGGVADPTDQRTQDAAIRELAEETGYVPLPGAKCIPLGWTHPNPAIQNNRCHCFVVGPVRREKKQNLDAGEMIDVVEVPIEEIGEKIRSGEITHALMLNTFLFLMLRSENGLGLLRSSLQEFQSKA